MTWEQVKVIIDKMSPAQLKKEVKYLEPYDDTKIYPVGVMKCEKTLRDEDGEFIKKGDWFLC